MIAAIIITAVVACALGLALGRWLGRREPRPTPAQRQLAQVIDFPQTEARIPFQSRRQP